MNLYQKGLLAFAVVILIAVATVALLIGQRTASEFRRYTALYSNRAQMLAASLADYYAKHASWDGVQSVLPSLTSQHGNGRGGQGNASGVWDFYVADVEGAVVADSSTASGVPARSFTLDRADIRSALPLVVGDSTVGYLLPESQVEHVLDDPSQQFLERVREASLWGGLVAFVAALLLAGVLTRSIMAPVRALTDASATIAQGDLSTRAPVHGRDEIAHLARTFNSMADSLQRAEESRQAQTADIAHELRNPLAILQGTLEALSDGVYAPTPDNIHPALDQVRTLNRLVSDLRTLALADAGQLTLDVQPVDLAQWVERVTETFRVAFAERGLALHVDASTSAPVQADYERLTQVLNNLLSNALRYVPRGGSVRVRVTEEAGGVAVRIADDGPGVPAEALPHLFERFWRAEPSRSRATGGSGLGLAIARHIIEAHKGRIAASATPGGGLTIAFWVPAA